MERIWSLLLEELSLIIWGGIISTSHRSFKVDHKPKEFSWQSMFLATTLNLEWQVVAQARLNCCVSSYNSESGMVGCGSGSLELLCLLLQLWIWYGREWRRLTRCGFEACRWPSFPPLSDTRWDDGKNSITRVFNALEQVLTYDWNIFLVVDAHFQEAIHPRWIFVLAEGFFWSICVKNGCADHNVCMG